MKQLATIGVVVLTLLGAAFYFGQQDKPQPPQPDPDPVVPDVEPPKQNQPVVSASADGTLKVRTAISNGYLMQGSSHDMYAAIDVEAIEHKGAKRPPLNVAVVIDRSGSMAGDKIEHAKAAARRLVNVLGEQDRVAVISYGSDVTVDFSSQPVTQSTRMSLFRAINNIAIGGGTNLSGGFQRGYNEISKWKNSEAVNRVILMSDGHANIGITNTHKLVGLSSNALSSKVSVSTIGVGLDYNEDLMTKMANQGAGNYYFVDQPSSIVGFLDSELQGLAATVAKNTAVVIKLGPGVTMQELHGFAHQASGNQVFVSLAEFHSEEKKNILLKLNVNAAELGEKPIIETNISYDDIITDKPTHSSLALQSIVTSDPAEAEKLVNVDVIARVQQVEVARTMEEAMNLWNDGNAQEAEKIIDSTQRKMRSRRAKYDFKGGERYDAVDKEMDEMKQQINSAPARSSEGKRYIKKKKARSNAIFQAVDSF
jgi:Ca-activated chloride channel family protein